MKLALVSASLVAMLSVVPFTQAQAWTRHGRVTTWRGTYHGTVSGGCGGGTCSRSATVTGPYGGTVSRSGSVTRLGPNEYGYSRTTTGPYGNSVTRSGTVTVNPY